MSQANIMASGPVLWKMVKMKNTPRFLSKFWVSYYVCTSMCLFYNSLPSSWRYHYSSFPLYLDLSPAFSSTQYTSNSSRITIPCSFAPDITWEHFKAKDIQEVYWQFSPKIPSGVISGGPQRLFTLSLQDSMKWNVNQHTDLKTQDPKKGDLSLTRKLGKEEDRGDYECIMKFKGGKILNRTVRVEVLQSKSKQIVWYKLNSVLHQHLSY